MADTAREKSSGFDWLYPDLLSKEDLIKTLKQRYISGVDVETLEKPHLVELYNQYIIPLPQRKYRQNRRGRQMTRKQIHLSKKRKLITTADSDEPAEKKMSSGGLLTSFTGVTVSQAGDRLKPPPSCVDFNKKTIKLGSSSASASTTSTTTSPALSMSIKKLTLSKSANKADSSVKQDSAAKSVSDSSSGKGPSMKKTIRLINNHLSSDSKPSAERSSTSAGSHSGDSSVEKMDTSTAGDVTKLNTTVKGDQPQVKKKIKISRISWP